MAKEYGEYGQEEKKSVWDTLTTGVGKFFDLKQTQEEQELAAIRLAQLQEQGKMTQTQADIEAAKQQGLTDQFLAKVKANKAVLIPLAIAGSIALVGFTFYYIKKGNKK